MSQVDYNLLVGAVVTVLVAALGLLAAWLRVQTQTITSHLQVIASTTRATAAKAGGGGGTYPTWNQLDDPGVGGVLPAGRYDECGEECCSIVIFGQHGVQTSADVLRTLIGGPARSPLTTAPDLVRILALNNVPASRELIDAAGTPAALQRITAAGGVAICLGTWVAAGVLHWILVTRADENGCGADDPWMGRRRVWNWENFRRAYAGDLVVITRHPDGP